ncbi:MAG: ATP-dependent helicase RecG, partial [Pseudomonadota bacterium]
MGAKTAQKLERIDLLSVQDLLFHLPLRYEDRTRLTPIAQARPGETVLVEGDILSVEIRQGARRTYLVRIQDASGLLTLRFFHFTRHQELQFTQGRRLRCFGEVRFGFQGLEVSHPDYEFPHEEGLSSPEACLTPVYPVTEGVHQKTLRQLVSQALEQIDGLHDLLELHPPPLPFGPSLKDA